VRMNMYLQSWSPKVSAASVGKDISDMMKVGRKYGLEMDAIAVSREIQGAMSIWYHRKSYGTRSLYNQGIEVVKCLQENHKIRLVRDAVLIQMRNTRSGNSPVRSCRCATCSVTKAITGCKHPHECFRRARALLDMLEEKWDPREPQPEDYEEDPGPRDELEPETEVFDARVTTHGTIADTFRIFTTNATRNLRDVAPDTRPAPDPLGEPIVIFTDGSATNNGGENARAGAGIFFGEGDPRNKAIRIPQEMNPSNNVGEIVA
ncbi:hypothetical protein B0H17DRAFT_890138, partial [Mycena rosella]